MDFEKIEKISNIIFRINCYLFAGATFIFLYNYSSEINGRRNERVFSGGSQ